ncbi:MAG TPA: Gldg family protein [Stellaceae bacterium]|nr:Gldg family protein [Stellaceae bacterium]
MSRRSLAIIGLLSAAILFVAVNVIAGRTLGTTRIDLTQGKLYTLSAGTRATLAKLDEPIVLRFYYSKKLGNEIPSYGVYAQRVREMLEEYAAASNGKIQLQELDPLPFSAVEDRAVAFGLQGVPLDQGGEQIYFGLAATNSTDDLQTIPFFQPERERFLEYDLTKLIHSLAFPKKPVIGLITDLPLQGDMMAAMQGQPMIPYAVMAQLKPLYEIKDLSSDIDSIPSDVDVLMVAHPQHLSEKAQYAIDQYVLGGGKALVFVDPNSETQQMHPSQLNPPGMPLASDLPKLFKAWGLSMDPKQVAGDRRAARRVNAGTQQHVEAMDYVAWLSLDQQDLNHESPITADLTHINMASAGILQPEKDTKTTFTPLITTSIDSMPIDVAKIKGVNGVPDVGGLLRDFKPSGEKLVLAAQVTGTAETAFPDGPPKDEKKDAKDDKKDGNAKAADAKPSDAKPAAPAGPPQIKTSTKPIDVIVVADTDVLEDRFWEQSQDFFGQTVVIPVANNGDFVANALDSLAGGDDLIALRSRGTSARPFTLVNDIQRAADARYQATEKDLQTKLKDTQGKIKQLQEQGARQGATVANEQEQTIENFRTDMLSIRQQLRQVQLALRQDINRLQAVTEFFDIALVPILVAIVAIIVGWVRFRRRKRQARSVAAV